MTLPLNDNDPSGEAFGPAAVRLGCSAIILGSLLGLASCLFVVWAVLATVEAIIQ